MSWRDQDHAAGAAAAKPAAVRRCPGSRASARAAAARDPEQRLCDGDYRRAQRSLWRSRAGEATARAGATATRAARWPREEPTRRAGSRRIGQRKRLRGLVEQLMARDETREVGAHAQHGFESLGGAQQQRHSQQQPQQPRSRKRQRQQIWVNSITSRL